MLEIDQSQYVAVFFNLFTSMLLEHTPVDTGNLLRNTIARIEGNKATITITAPSKYVDIGDYAPYVNYAPILNVFDRGFEKGEDGKMHHKRKKIKNPNYHYIERYLLQAAEIMVSTYGGTIQNEL